MKNRMFRPGAFFTAFAAGVVAVVLCFQFRQLEAEYQTLPSVDQTIQPTAAPKEDLNYDKARYEEIKSAVESIIKNRMQESFSEIPFDEVSEQLSLENVSWDEGYSNAPNGQIRIYHFRGFYLVLSLAKLMPDNPPTWTSVDLEKKGIWYLYHFYPAVHIDGVNNPKERMDSHWEGIKAAFKKRNDDLKREREIKKSKKNN